MLGVITQFVSRKQAPMILLFGLIILPLAIKSDYLMHVLITIGLYVVLSLSLNLVAGFTGQLSIGHAAFYGIGAYVTALLMLNYNVPYWATIPISGLITALFGLLLGLPTLRLQGDYLAIVTLGFGEIVRLVFLNWDNVTRGPMGLPGIPSPEIGSYMFFSKIPFYYLILVILIITILFMVRVAESEFGLSLIAVSHDEVAAEAVGVHTTRAKLLAFTFAALFAGIAGGYYATYISFVSPDSFTFMDSVTILAMVVLGGLASIPGVVIGAIVLGLAPEVLRFMADYRMLLYGALMVGMMIFKPEGFWGANKRVRNVILKNLDKSHHLTKRGGTNWPH
ncbi:branched-chain amino acid ABC transporter permease [Desulfosporosinus burensis]